MCCRSFEIVSRPDSTESARNTARANSALVCVIDEKLFGKQRSRPGRCYLHRAAIGQERERAGGHCDQVGIEMEEDAVFGEFGEGVQDADEPDCVKFDDELGHGGTVNEITGARGRRG